jgi:mannosyltransferase OCH1-like enzyme
MLLAAPYHIRKRLHSAVPAACAATLLIIVTAFMIHLPAISQMWQDKKAMQKHLQLQTMKEESEMLPQLKIRQLLRLVPMIPSIRGSSIPKIIHQSYKTTTLPQEFKEHRKSWPKHHPSWVYQFWTDEVCA